MAKKKPKKTVKNQLLSPIAFKRTFVLFSIIVAVAVLNIYVFIISPAKEIKKDQVISQSELLNVLGANVSIGEDIKETYAPFISKPEVKYWYDLLAQKPDFKDAHIILASYAYNDHNCQLAQSHINTAYNIDPIDHQVIELMNTIKSCNE